ncbi:PucR family transcriptional regulator ligand-binding domain-containing protein [Streptomyces sp. NPDC059169]|uniref:helix-turn-helix domain-containing protein n=1 Tax=Streptomyces sp. NPDC059169 TaxID=3346754 RepID=UPI0036B6534B
MVHTLGRLLANPNLGLKLRTGRADVAVHWAHVSDLVDPTPYLDRGSLLLTTGLSLGRTSRRWPEYVDRLARAGVPGVGFGVGLRHAQIPEPLISAAVQRGLSVVEVPKPTPFSSVVRMVADGLMAEERAEQSASMERYRGLVRAALIPPPHRSIVTRLAGLLDAWVLLLSREGNLLAGAPDHARRYAERVRLEVSRTRSWHAAAFDHGDARVILLSVGQGSRPAGVLAIGRTLPLGVHERGVVDVAVDLLSLGVAQAAELLDSERRERTTVLSMLLSDRVAAATDAADALGIPLPEPPVRIAVLTTDAARRDDLLELLENTGGLQIVSALVACESRGRVAVVLPAVEGETGVMHTIISRMRGSAGVISEPVDLGGLAKVWPKIVALADTLPSSATGRLLSTKDVADVGLLSYVSKAEADGWAFATLAPLESEDARRIDLLTTVRTYLAHNGNTEAASAALEIHRRTLAYRLNRAETLLGRRFSDPALRAELWMAFTARDR